MPKYESLIREYKELYDSLQIRSPWFGNVTRKARDIIAGRETYERIESRTKVPWYVIGIIHAMECTRFPAFTQHLHNGDPLSSRTRQVPRGRPTFGNAPFTFEDSAVDALTYDGLSNNTDWCVERIAYLLEDYNGWGTRSRGVHTPYLWSGCQHYNAGKFVADHVWSPTAVSDQEGAMLLLKRIAELTTLELARADRPTPFVKEEKPKLRDSGTLSGVAQAAFGSMVLWLKSIGAFIPIAIAEATNVKSTLTEVMVLADKQVGNIGMACIVVGCTIALTRRITANIEGREG